MLGLKNGIQPFSYPIKLSRCITSHQEGGFKEGEEEELAT